MPRDPENARAEGAVTRVNGRRRLRVQIYVDVLLAIHRSQKKGEPVHLYTIERSAGLAYPRLKDCLSELRDAGFLGPSLEVTERGYAFLADLTTKVIPIMEKYGLWRDFL